MAFSTLLGLPDFDSALVLNYSEMCTSTIEMHWLLNLGALVSSWLTLAGFLVFPNSFTSLGLGEEIINTAPGALLKSTTRSVPKPVAPIICCILGFGGTCVLWRSQRNNYVWLRGLFWYSPFTRRPMVRLTYLGLVSIILHLECTPLS
jgi:hypothetical protein